MSLPDLLEESLSDPSLLQTLTAEQRDRLTEILDRYFIALEQGVPQCQEEILAANLDLAEPLELYFKSFEQVHEMAVRFTGAPQGAVPPEPLGAEAETRRIGDFELIRELGRGGMGVVYEARQISLDRRVALKTLPFAAVLDAKQIARFKNEAQAAAQLHHPNIVPVYAIGAERGVHYFAMQYIDGQPLDRAIEELRSQGNKGAAGTPGNDAETIEFIVGSTQRSSGTRGTKRPHEHVRTSVSLGIAAARALHAAHEMGVVHRDVKPSNLLLDSAGKIWVADFGLARCQANASLTRTGEVLGSMRYMSPEQAAGRTPLVDHRTDVYSLGATLYELIALRPAFGDEDGPSLLRKIEQVDPPALRTLRQDVSIDLQSVIAKAMAKQPSERYGTAAEFADDLQRVLNGQATLAKPPSVVERMTKWTRRHAQLVTIVTAASLLATVGLAAATLLVVREKQKTDVALRSAEQDYLAARATVDDVFQATESLAHVPGAEKVRSDLLGKTLEYYQGFVAQASARSSEDEELWDNIALTYSKIGELSADLGARQDAIAAHEQSRAWFQRLVEREPGVVEHRRRLAMATNNLANVLGESGNAVQARALFAEAVAMQDAIVKAMPGDAAARGELALIHSNRGLFESRMRDSEVAEASLRQAVSLRDKLVSEAGDKASAEQLRGLATAYNNLIAQYLHRRPEQAAPMAVEAIALQQKAAALSPPDDALLAEMALSHNNYGAIRSNLKEHREAAAEYRRAIDLQRTLVEHSPMLGQRRRELAVSLNNLGMVEAELNELDRAEASFRLALAQQEELSDAAARELEMQSCFGGIHNNLGMVLERASRLPEAIEQFELAVKQQRAAFDAATSKETYRFFLSKHLGNLGRALRGANRPSEAIDAALERRALWPADQERLLAVAEELALVGQTVGGTNRERCQALVVETLRSAAASGDALPGDFMERAAFAGLRGNPQIQALVKP
jgi:serine/threonine protein kinase/tetratricopeptide (TPR) repeat protein